MDGRIYLKELNVKNYRSLVDTHLVLNEQLTALIGINGSGKTNALSAIKLLKQLLTGHARHARYGETQLSQDATTTLVAHFSFNNVIFGIKADILLDNTDGVDNIQYFDLYLEKKGKQGPWLKLDPEALDFADYLQRSRNSSHAPGMNSRYLPANAHDQDFIIGLAGFLRGISYYGATVFSDPTKSPISFELDEEGIITKRQARRGHHKFLYDLYMLKQEDEKAYKRYQNIVGSLGLNLIDNIDFPQVNVPNSSVTIKAGGQTEKTTSTRTVVVPIFTVGELQLSPNQLSEGTFKTLALVFYVMNDKSNLMLIEEPEVGIHHGLLSGVVELIRVQSRNKQIIVSTHSDYVLDRLEPEAVSLVRKENPQGTTVESLDKALSEDDYHALKIYLEETGSLGEYWKEDGFSFK